MAANESFGIWNLREINRGLTESRYYSATYDIELLLIGGGGAAGGWSSGGGGGGAGGLIYSNALTLRKGCTYPITIGAGAAPNFQNPTTVGANSTFCYVAGSPLSPAGVNIIALGGGSGGNSPGLTGAWFGPEGGGSGGGQGGYYPGLPTGSNPLSCPINGATRQNNPTLWGGLPCVLGYGNVGGCKFCPTTFPAPVNSFGGGGGAGGAGGNAPGTAPAGAGVGGLGLIYSISGQSKGYAGGGPGAVNPNSPTTNTSGYNFCYGASPSSMWGPIPGANPGSWGACAPCPNTGAGAAGIGDWGACPCGASGVAIIRYDGATRGVGGNTVVTCSTPTTKTSHIFTGSGCYLA
jgi:mucin-19